MLTIDNLGKFQKRITLVEGFDLNFPKVYTCVDGGGMYHLILVIGLDYLLLPITYNEFFDLTLTKKNFSEIVLASRFGYYVTLTNQGYTAKEIAVFSFLCDYFIKNSEYQSDSTMRHLSEIRADMLNLGKPR